jgi:hypothetical protein
LNELEDIIKKYKALEKKNIEDKAELKVLDKKLKDDFNCGSLDELKERLESINKEKDLNEQRRDKLMDRLKNIIDWDSIEE